MKGLIKFIRFIVNSASQYLATAFARALCIQLPPQNYVRTPSSTSANEKGPSFNKHDDPTTLSVERPVAVEGDFCTRMSVRKRRYMAPKYLKPSETNNMAMLRAASDRISDILQEHRRRVDAGEDPCPKRKEARRRRTEELVLLVNAL